MNINSYTEKTMLPIPFGDSLPFDFELNGIPFGSKSKGKLLPRSYPIQCEMKLKSSFFIVTCSIFYYVRNTRLENVIGKFHNGTVA